MVMYGTGIQGGTICGLSSLARFLKILSSKRVCCVFRDIRDKNAVNEGFWSKTAVFNLPATKVHCLLIFWLPHLYNLLQPGIRKQHKYTSIHWGLRSEDRGLRIEKWGPRIEDWELRIEEWGVRTGDSFTPSGSSFLIPHSPFHSPQSTLHSPQSSVFMAFETKKILKNPQKLKKSSLAANQLTTTCATLLKMRNLYSSLGI